MFVQVSVFEFPSKKFYPQTRITGSITYLFPNPNNVHTWEFNVYLFSLTDGWFLNTRTTILLVMNLFINKIQTWMNN